MGEKKRRKKNRSCQKSTCAEGVALTTCGGIPETGTAPLGGRFLLVTEAHENGCRENKNDYDGRQKISKTE